MDSDNQYLRGTPRLNFDILHQICNHLSDVSDVLSFALTCSVLTKPAFIRRLRMSPINLSNDKSVDRFHRFIFADKAARVRYIYGLKLPDPHLYRFGTRDARFQETNDRLVAILQAAARLEYLYIPTTTLFDPVLTAAAARVTSIYDLHVACDGDFESLLRILGTFRSPLRSLRINKGARANGEKTSMKLLHNHLAKFAPSLEVLELPDVNFDISPSLITTQFTAMRSVKIRFVHKFKHSMVETLLLLFPNLDNTLDLGSLTYSVVSTMDHRDMRRRSKEAQKTRAWSGLRRVACDAELAFLVSLVCPIRSLDIKTSEFHNRRPISPILHHNCPQRLQLSLLSRHGDPWNDLDSLFPREGVDPLTHLVLFADFDIPTELPSTSEPLPWTHFQDKLIAMIAHLRITHLRVVFYYAVHLDTQTLSLSIERPPVQTVGDTDLPTAMTGFFDAIPTLKCILLTTCGFTYHVPSGHGPVVRHSRARRILKKWLSSKAWRIADDHADSRHLQLPTEKSDSPVMVALSREDAERILDKEELRLSHESMVRECSE